MAPLPAFRFPSAATQLPVSNSGQNFFEPVCLGDTEGNLEKYYGMILTCVITRAVKHADLNTILS